MTIPLWFILVLWGIFIGFTVLLSLVNLFHILHYGFWTFKSALFSLFYYGAVIIILYWAWTELGSFNWNQPLVTFGIPAFSIPASL
ncbi:hypothetical protein HYW17_04325 [Candidatus Uhrbacteria bacterium]|nr:hypothetical protein [Candidatus Uhrbacteria bacterium]